MLIVLNGGMLFDVLKLPSRGGVVKGHYVPASTALAGLYDISTLFENQPLPCSGIQKLDAPISYIVKNVAWINCQISIRTRAEQQGHLNSQH
jgi:hypothetical protein